MVDPRASERPHQKHLEQARAQVQELLSRQAVESDLVNRTPQRQSEVVSQLLLRQQRAALQQRLSSLHPADLAYVLEGLDPDERDLVWSLVPSARRGAVMLETSDSLRRALIQGMPPEAIVALVHSLPAEDIAQLIAPLPEQTRSAILEHLDQRERSEVRSVLSFPAGSVGAAMDLDFVVAREDATLGDVLRSLQRRHALPAHNNQVFVIDQTSQVTGVLPIEQLLLGAPSAPVRQAMTTDVVLFYTDDPMRDAVSAFEKYDLVSAPVVNLHQQLVGRLTVDAVLDEINERAQAEGLRQVGLSSEDEDLFAPVRSAAKRRWPWLAINVCTALVASRVIGAFEPLIGKLAALAALMPIVASMGGNAGNQSVALVIQSLSRGALQGRDLLRFIAREASIAALNGAVWGCALGLIAWFLYHNLRMSCVLALALLLNLMVGALVGVLTPALLQRAGRDPVLGSSVILTATTDGLGFLLFLGLATIFLG